MCGRKPGQTFFVPGAQGATRRQLLTGAGVLDSISLTNVPAANAILRFRDGTNESSDARVIWQGVFTAAFQAVALADLNFQFQDGLIVETVTPTTMDVTVGAYIQDRSPDPMTIQLARVADELARVGAINEKLAAFVKGLELGDPAT